MRDFKTKMIFLEGVLFICIIGLVFGFGIIWQRILENNREDRLFPDHGVPRVNIDLNGVELETIKNGSKDIKYDGNKIRIIEGKNKNNYDNVTLKGRGNGTWVQDKKPFQIKFEDKVDLFGMGKARKWYLLANNLDSTHLRNKAAAKIEKMLEMEYVIDSRYIELYVNEEYEGLYYLTPAMEIGKNSVDLRDENGVLVELDNIYGSVEEYYLTSSGDYLTIKDMVNWDNKNDVMSNFLDSYNRLESAINEKKFNEIQALIDVDSWAKYYLLSEFIVNPDAYWTSFYLYKDGLDDKIHAGPGWDFDLAFANKTWKNWIGSRFYSPTETMIRKQELLLRDSGEVSLGEFEYMWSGFLSTVVFDLMEISEFKERVIELYQRYFSGREDELINEIMVNANYIRDGAVIDNKKWNKGDFDVDLKEMVDWINRRYSYFEIKYGMLP